MNDWIIRILFFCVGGLIANAVVTHKHLAMHHKYLLKIDDNVIGLYHEIVNRLGLPKE